jgi:hypothetical protein
MAGKLVAAVGRSNYKFQRRFHPAAKNFRSLALFFSIILIA